ncbi:MAG: BrnT family toxin [Dehalococcoidia bacterium]|nr:BrnT family toxin [Dehalococcoidia bacterium]MSQ17552.1 BrnT family toxin [Dehalococcoidia bacterium]
MEFEWDENKNRTNIAKHGITFRRAIRIFAGDVLEFVDDRRDYGETRAAAIGVVDGVPLYVVYTRRGEVRRIISARRANRYEREKYRQAYPERSP